MTRRTNILVAVLMLAAVGVVGCESSTPSSPAPDTAAPAAVTALQGSPAGGPSVSLSWTAGSELDLAGYKISRRTVWSDKSMSEVQPIVSVTQPSFQDYSVQPGTSYLYGVTAYDASNNESPQAVIRVDVPPPDSAG